MKVTYDPNKRALTLEQRGLDFEDAVKVFAGRTATLQDDRKDYGEIRYQTYGFLDGSTVMVVWTPRAEARHIISMRKCHGKEKARVRLELGGP